MTTTKITSRNIGWQGYGGCNGKRVAYPKPNIVVLKCGNTYGVFHRDDTKSLSIGTSINNCCTLKEALAIINADKNC